MDTNIYLETRRGAHLYTERSDIDGVIIFLLFFASFWLFAGGLLSLPLNRTVSIGFFAAGVLFILCGIFVIIHGIFRERDLSYLKTTGMRVETAYSPTSNDDVLITTGINPVNGLAMEFRSYDAWFKPVGVLKMGDMIDVYVDPKKPSRYYMDFAPFEERVNALQNDPGT